MSGADEAHTAETSPVWRRAAKTIALCAWVAATVAAMGMTLDVMLAKAGDAPQPWLVAALVTVGLACDFWVGAGPVLIVSARRWGFKVLGWVGVAALALALTITFTNKIDFWGARADARQDTAARVAVARDVDVLAADRALLSANPTTRPAAVVRAELEGLNAQIAPLEAQGARYRSLLVDLRAQRRALAAELATAQAVEAARVRVVEAVSASPDDAHATTRVATEHLARDRWLSDAATGLAAWAPAAFGWLRGVTPGLVEQWMNGLFAVFHELLCLTALSLATLGQPAAAVVREALLRAQRATAKQRADLEVRRELAKLEQALAADALAAELDAVRERDRQELARERDALEAAKARSALRREAALLRAQDAAAAAADPDQVDLFASPAVAPAPPASDSPAPQSAPAPDYVADPVGLAPEGPQARRGGLLSWLFGARDETWRRFSVERPGRRWWERKPEPDEPARHSGRALPGWGWDERRGPAAKSTAAERRGFREDSVAEQRARLERELADLEAYRATLRKSSDSLRFGEGAGGQDNLHEDDVVVKGALSGPDNR